MTLVAAFTYPWDVIGDPEAAGRLRDLGADTVVLAAAYHSTTAITPRHPLHRIVTARSSAVYYPPEAARWDGAALRPVPQEWCGIPDPYGAAAARLREAGLAVHAWVVLTHNSRLAQAHPAHAVRNAYGDRYGWALCAAQSAVRAYAADLAAEAAAQPGTTGVELEACGWYGREHLHAHDKTTGVPFREAASYLLSLCFCPACAHGYASHGTDPGRLRDAVREALDPLWHADADDAGPGDGDGWDAVRGLLGADLAEATLAHRLAAARRLRQEVTAAVREQAPGCRIVLHADPVPHRTGANVGVAVAEALADTDGIVVPAALTAAAAAAAAAAAGPAAWSGKVLAANHQVIAASGGHPDFVPPAAATEIRLYHPGLASDRDLRAAAAAVSRFLAARGTDPRSVPRRDSQMKTRGE
ncbi:MAG: hypothetical protein ACRDNW_08020 [Trebonia sp.]